MRFASFASLALVAALTLVTSLTGCARIRRYQNDKARAAAREHPALMYIPQPVARSGGSPLVGTDEVDADGAPLKYVDRAQVRAMLAHKEYAALTKLFEDTQAQFEAHPANEAWPMEAAESFESGESALDLDLDAWVAASPASFAPYLARGVHHTMVGYAQRGAAGAKETAERALRSMQDSYAAATVDLQKAITLRPGAQEAFRQLARIGGHTGDRAALEKAMTASAAACPSCFRVRSMYITMQTPRWGGSYAAMDAFAAANAKAGPKTKYLAGYADLDRSRTLEDAGKHDLALPVIDRAFVLGDHWEFFLQRAIVEHAGGETERAFADVQRANELRPGYPDILVERANQEADSEQWEAAGMDLRSALQMNPTSFAALASGTFIFEGLVAHAQEALEEKKTAEATREAAIAADLGPDDPRVRRLRGDVVLTGSGSMDDLRRAVAEDPGNFAAIQQLDAILGKRGEAEQMIPIWTAYLARHPDDGRGYLERGGTYFNAHHIPEATADANKACSLGNGEGCLRARQLAGGMTH